MNLKKLLLLPILLVLALSAFGQQVTIPASAFNPPCTPLDMTLNGSYCNGYAQGETVAAAILPLPASPYFTFWLYRAAIYPLTKTTTVNGSVINANVGFNEALYDAGNYLWTFWPASCHNTQCQLN